jgi:hypothetical protein
MVILRESVVGFFWKVSSWGRWKRVLIAITVPSGFVSGLWNCSDSISPYCELLRLLLWCSVPGWLAAADWLWSETRSSPVRRMNPDV